MKWWEKEVYRNKQMSDVLPQTAALATGDLSYLPWLSVLAIGDATKCVQLSMSLVDT